MKLRVRLLCFTCMIFLFSLPMHLILMLVFSQVKTEYQSPEEVLAWAEEKSTDIEVSRTCSEAESSLQYEDYHHGQ